MIVCRAIRALSELPFAAGDWLIQHSPIGGEIVPAMPTQEELDALIADVFSVTNLTDNGDDSR